MVPVTAIVELVVGMLVAVAKVAAATPPAAAAVSAPAVVLATEIVIIIVINLIYIAQFDTNGILTALYIVITYIHMQYVHV